MGVRLVSVLHSCSYAELRGETMLGHVCAALVSEMAAQVGPFDPYNLLNACSADSLKHGANRARAARVLAASANSAITSLRRPVTPGDGDGGVGSSCLGDVMSEWLLLPQTLEAIGSAEPVAHRRRSPPAHHSVDAQARHRTRTSSIWTTATASTTRLTATLSAMSTRRRHDFIASVGIC